MRDEKDNDTVAVTVIVTLYNKGPWINRCIDSILRQSFTSFELLVVNDGSTDNGVKKVASYSDPRIRIIHKKNGGLSTARNRGVDEAAGRYFTFVDADDEIMEHHLEKLVQGFSLDHEVIAVGDMLLEKFGDTLQTPRIPFAVKDAEKRDGCYFWVMDSYMLALGQGCFLLSGSSTMVRRDIVRHHSLYFNPEAEPAEDVNYWIRLSRFGKFVYIDYPGATWHHVDIGSIMMRSTSEAQFVPPFLLELQASLFTDQELQYLAKFIKREYWKKAYQNRGKEFTGRELASRFDFIRLPLGCAGVYLLIRFMPGIVLRLVKKFNR